MTLARRLGQAHVVGQFADDGGDLRPEAAFDLVEGHPGIFDGVVQPGCGDRDLVAVVAGHEIGHFLEVHGIGKPLRPAPVLTVVGIAGKTFRLSDHVSLPTAYPAGPA